MSWVVYTWCTGTKLSESQKLKKCEVKLSPVFYAIILRAIPCSFCKLLSANQYEQEVISVKPVILAK